MPVISSKLSNGTLTFGATGSEEDFSCQVTNVRIEPSHDVEEGVETLCGEREPDSLTTTDALMGTAIQDFTAPGGFVEYTWTNHGQTIAFVFKPTAQTAPSVAGSCQIRRVVLGGDVAKKATFDFEFPCSDIPTITWPSTGP